MPIRDVNDIIVAQTGVIGHADVICTMDDDFYDSTMIRFFGGLGIVVMDDVALMRRLRTVIGHLQPPTATAIASASASPDYSHASGSAGSATMARASTVELMRAIRRTAAADLGADSAA